MPAFPRPANCLAGESALIITQRKVPAFLENSSIICPAIHNRSFFLPFLSSPAEEHSNPFPWSFLLCPSPPTAWQPVGTQAAKYSLRITAPMKRLVTTRKIQKDLCGKDRTEVQRLVQMTSGMKKMAPFDEVLFVLLGTEHMGVFFVHGIYNLKA